MSLAATVVICSLPAGYLGFLGGMLYGRRQNRDDQYQRAKKFYGGG